MLTRDTPADMARSARAPEDSTTTLRGALAPRVLVVEDETDLRSAMVQFLALEGITAHGVGTLRDADQWLREHPADVLVLDLGLPDGDGVAWLNSRADTPEMGVIMTTARGASTDRISGVRAGADAYLVKPVELAELALMVRNVTRRVRPSAPPSGRWRVHKLEWLLEAPSGATMKLTRSEAVLLRAVAEHPGMPVDRRVLAERLGEDLRQYDMRRMEILVRRMRRKAEQQFGVALPFETAHGIGYAFTAPIEQLE